MHTQQPHARTMGGARGIGRTDRRGGGGRRRGFTLVEMLIVIVILGILAMIIIPQISTSTDEARLNTLRTNLAAMRSSIEIYYAQHNGAYPGDGVPATKPGDVVTAADAFVAQLTRYTDQDGNIANAKDATYKFGPYIKGGGLPMNPFNSLGTVTIDNATTDITAKDSTGAGTGWKFYSKTGVLMAADGAHDTE
jgi:prepilin-type N-terminal cleavage/methylation domain-containing protein